MARIIHQDWRTQQSQSNYPFADSATMEYDSNLRIAKTMFIDAHIHPVGGSDSMYLSRIEVDSGEITIHVGKQGTASLCSGSFNTSTPVEVISLSDDYGRPGGLLVGDSVELLTFGNWPNGTYDFTSSQLPFAASVCVPTPEVGVRGVILESGDVFLGDAWLVGENGVVVRTDTDVTGQSTVVRIDIVGDPLFKRAQCDKQVDSPLGTVSLFSNKNYLKTINGLPPDKYGDFRITAGGNDAPDTILRVYPTESGLKFEFVGEKSTR